MKSLRFLSAAFCLAIILNACKGSGNASTSTDTTDVAAAEVAPATPATTITGKKWKLIELAGQPVADSINGKEPFIQFKLEDSSYAANGGCNGLGGKFELDEKTLRIKFKQGMSTMMACPDMKVEDGLKQVFQNTDNYTLGDSTLSLNKARMAPLARFRAVE